MGLFDWATNQFIEIIEWQDAGGDTVAWHFPVYRNEIKYGAQLIVREGQSAVFLNEGVVADVFPPGRHTLTTANLPVLATLKGWKYGFESPFKADVVFIATRRFTNLKWGTQNPVMLRDADFGVLRLRAFGTYALRVTDGKALIGQLAAANAQTTVGDLQDHLRNKLIARFTDTLGERRIPALDLASRYDEIGSDLEQRLNQELAPQGLALTDLAVENISLPPEVEQALDTRSKMNLMGDLNKFTQYQVAQSIPAVAANPGLSGTGMGMGLGAGIGAVVGQQMAQSLHPPQVAPADPFAAQAPVAGATAAQAPAASPVPVSGAKFCMHCGAPLPAGARFCPGCGKGLG